MRKQGWYSSESARLQANCCGLGLIPGVTRGLSLLFFLVLAPRFFSLALLFSIFNLLNFNANIYIYIYIYIWGQSLPWRKVLNAVVAELGIYKLVAQTVLSDERLGAKLRVTENRCVLFDSFTYIYIYIYIFFFSILAGLRRRGCGHSKRVCASARTS